MPVPSMIRVAKSVAQSRAAVCVCVCVDCSIVFVMVSLVSVGMLPVPFEVWLAVF